MASWQPPLTFVTLLVTLPPGVTRRCTNPQEPGLAAKLEGLRERLVPLLCSIALTWVVKLGYCTIFFAIILKKSLLGKWKILKSISVSFIHYLQFLFKSGAICCELSNFPYPQGSIPQMHPVLPVHQTLLGSAECSCS